MLVGFHEFLTMNLSTACFLFSSIFVSRFFFWLKIKQRRTKTNTLRGKEKIAELVWNVKIIRCKSSRKVGRELSSLSYNIENNKEAEILIRVRIASVVYQKLCSISRVGIDSICIVCAYFYIVSGCS